MKLSQYYEAKPFIINQAWGVKNPVYEQFGFSRHNGTDCQVGTNGHLYSPFPCEVTKIGWQPSGAGLYVCVLSQSQYDFKDKKAWVEKTYMHLDKVLVKVGDKLNVGDVIAKADNTGFSTGPHTHIASKRVNKTTGGYYEVDKNDAKNTFDDTPFYNGKYAVDEQITLLKQTIALLTKLIPYLK